MIPPPAHGSRYSFRIQHGHYFQLFFQPTWDAAESSNRSRESSLRIRGKRSWASAIPATERNRMLLDMASDADLYHCRETQLASSKFSIEKFPSTKIFARTSWGRTRRSRLLVFGISEGFSRKKYSLTKGFQGVIVRMRDSGTLYDSRWHHMLGWWSNKTFLVFWTWDSDSGKPHSCTVAANLATRLLSNIRAVTVTVTVTVGAYFTYARTWGFKDPTTVTVTGGLNFFPRVLCLKSEAWSSHSLSNIQNNEPETML